MTSGPLTTPSIGTPRLRTAIEAYQNFERAFAALGSVERLRFLLYCQKITVYIFLIGLLSGIYLLFGSLTSGESNFSSVGIISVAQGANTVAPNPPPVKGDPALLFAGEHLTIFLIFAGFIVCCFALLFVREERVVGVFDRLAMMLAGALTLDALIHVLIHILRTAGA
jgi:hypothetical protein